MTTALLAIAFSALWQDAPKDLPFLSPIFNDHMVLQRDRANIFWGWDKPGTTVTVSIANKRARGIAGADGKWMVKLSPPPTGGPYRLIVEGEKRVELEDVLVGDVWVCSGQSNMEQGIGNVNNFAEEIAAANHPNIRLAMVPKNVQFEPIPVVPTSWSVCTPENIARGGWEGFSGVAYFFGRELNKRLNVPIGLIEDCWGGTILEAWASRASVAKQGDFAATLAQLDQQKASGITPFHQQVDSWLARLDPGSKSGANWQASTFDDGAWKPSTVPPTYEGIGLGGFDGVVWFRAEVALSGDVSGAAKLSLGPVDDADTTWVNGVRVGATFQHDTPREYAVPAGTLKPGRNVIAVRAIDTGGPGGLTGSADDLYLQLDDGRKATLASAKWRFAQGTALNVQPGFPQPTSGNPNVATVLYNAMIHPIVPLAIKGAIWYQGESNAGRAYQYRDLMPMLINDWRSVFGQPNLPFFIVQLANFTARQPQPGESDWAELREAQFMATQKLRNVGIACAIDIGEANDIHPRNKQDVGIRLALSALKVAYSQNLAHSGPTYRSMKIEGTKGPRDAGTEPAIRISFNHAEGGLKGTSSLLRGFAIAGADRKFVWADAKLDGDTVVVSSPQVPVPVAVRYAWANNPETSLTNGAGLPAFPFRTDDWQGVTFGRK